MDSLFLIIALAALLGLVVTIIQIIVEKIKKTGKPRTKQLVAMVLALVISFGAFMALADPVADLLSQAVIKDIQNGSRTEVIGQVSTLKIDKDKVTEELISDWYFNHFKENDLSWAVIKYKGEDVGVFTSGGQVFVNENLSYEMQDDVYMDGGPTDDTITYVERDGKLVKE